MLICTGKVPQSEPWRILEVATNQSPDVMAIRLSKELKRLHASAEILVPFTPNAAGRPTWIVEHVYVRGLNGSLPRLASTAGIDFTRKEYAPPDWIAQLLEHEKPQKLNIGVGSFVRVLSGPCARMCGSVTRVHDGTLTVTLPMRTKNVKVHTIYSNLQLIECPPDKQSFFFS
jgi:transcription antitermination factor NusG